MRCPFFGTKFLLMLLLPLYLGSLIVAAVPRGLRCDFKSTMRPPLPLVEILASLLVACLLFAAIGLTTHTAERQHTVVARELPQLAWL